VANVDNKVGAWTRAVWVAAALMVLALGASEWLRPRRILADTMAPMVLEQAIPKRFGDWAEMSTSVPVISDPTIEAAMKQVYSSSLVRTYSDKRGHIIFLSLAYGKNQNSWSTAAHRPEFCYGAQGFKVTRMGVTTVPLSQGHGIEVERLLAVQESREEPISYWVTLADTPTLPGLRRKVQQVRYGLQGWIVDGLLVRISSVGVTGPEAYDVHEKFMRDLNAAMPRDFRARFFGGT
jgi:EpsI family protein